MDISENLGLTLKELEPAIAELADAQLISMTKAENGALIAQSPDLAIASLIGPQEQRIAELQHEVATQRIRLSRLDPVYQRAKAATDRSSGYEILESSRAINNLIDDLVRQTTQSLYETLPGQGPTTDKQLEGIESDQRLRDLRVKRKTILHQSTRTHPPTIRAVQAQVEIGCQVRTAELIPARMFLFDDSAAIISRNAFPGDRAALYTRDRNLVNLLTLVYTDLWSKSEQFEPETGQHEPLSQLQKSILRLLAAGYSDASAVKRLAISLRTYRRQVAEIMEALQAESRFQAGAIASQQGLI